MTAGSRGEAGKLSLGIDCWLNGLLPKEERSWHAVLRKIWLRGLDLNQRPSGYEAGLSENKRLCVLSALGRKPLSRLCIRPHSTAAGDVGPSPSTGKATDTMRTRQATESQIKPKLWFRLHEAAYLCRKGAHGTLRQALPP